MIELENRKVECPNLDCLLISWTVKETEEDLSDYNINLYRGQTPEDFEKIKVIDPSADTSRKDMSINLRNRWRIFYYKLEVENKNTHETTEYDPIFLTYEPDYVALTLVDKYLLQLSRLEFGGREAQFFIKKTMGPRCPKCWDPIKKRKKTSNCELCYGTGFTGGYFDSIDNYFCISEEVIENIHTVWGVLSPNQKLAWSANYPLVKVSDIIREKRIGKNWRVVQRVQRKEKSGFCVKQIFVIQEVNRKDVEYQLGVIR